MLPLGSIPPPYYSDKKLGDTPSPPRQKGTEMVFVTACSKTGTSAVAAEHSIPSGSPVRR